MPSRPKVSVVGAAIFQGDRCLVAQRGDSMALAGKWEFPGGKVEKNETPAEALAREIREELGLSIRVGVFLGRGSATINGRTIELEVFSAEVLYGQLRLREHAQVDWARAEELADFDWAEADVPVLNAVRQHLLQRRGATDPTA